MIIVKTFLDSKFSYLLKSPVAIVLIPFWNVLHGVLKIYKYNPCGAIFGTFEDDLFVDYWLEKNYFPCLVDQPYLDQR